MRDLKFKLVEIEIENFLSYKNAKFSKLKDYNVLIGKNNSGKSNLIKILKLIGYYFSDGVDDRATRFNTFLLFDENVDAEAKISLTFKLSKIFKREILNKLSNYMTKFLINIDKPSFIDNLINNDYLNSIRFIFAFDKEIRNLFLKDIFGIHKISNELYPILEGTFNGKTLHIISNKTHELASDIDAFFGNNLMNSIHQTYPKNILYSTFLNVSKGSDLGENILLRTILIEFFNYFKDRVKYVPANRFIPSSDNQNSNKEKKILLENGSNFVPFIFNKRNTLKGEPWMEEYEKEIIYFFPDIKKFSQDSGSGRVETYFLENNLKMPIKNENMGSAFMHIAFIIAFMKELKKEDIFLIEEPELFIFPGLQNKMRNMFLEKSSKYQIFITTHSSKFLSENEEKCSIYSVQKRKNESTVKLVPKDNIKEIFDDLNKDLNEYEKDKEILYDENFWKKFILKAMQQKDIEDILWDFKQILEWWKSECKVKEQKQIKFCEKIASFSNSDGGVLIIGITNEIPRKIIGVDDAETKIEDCGKKIRKYIDYKRKFYYITAIKLKDQQGKEKNCVIIVVKQTKKVIGVKHKPGYISYKIRTHTGVESLDRDLIKDNKRNVPYDNYDFLNFLKTFCENNSKSIT